MTDCKNCGNEINQRESGEWSHTEGDLVSCPLPHGASFAAPAPKNPLREGIVGRQIVAYFEELDGRVAVGAESIEHLADGQHDYLITFEGGQVQAYRVTFSDTNIFTSSIIDASPLN